MLRSHFARLCLVTFLTAFVSASPLVASCPTTDFVELSPVALGHNAEEFAIADVNGDNDLDIVSVSTSAQNINVLLGNGDGTFSLPLSYNAPSPGEVALGDLNNDQFPDIVVSSEPAQTEQCVSFGSCAGVSILLNDGDGTFGNATTIPVPFAASIVSIDIADSDDDGKQDVLVGAPPIVSTDVDVHVFFGDGMGALPTRHSWAVDGPVLAARFAQINGPFGQPDAIVVAGPSASSTFTRMFDYQSQSGAFPLVGPARVLGGDTPESYVATGDFNHDESLDVAPTLSQSASTSSGISVQLGHGSGSFSSGSSVGTNLPRISGIVVEDVNEDGVDDFLVVANTTEWRTLPLDVTGAVTLGNSHSGFFAFGVTAKRVATGDFDHDGRPDFFFLDTANDNVLILHNQCSSRYAKVTAQSSPNPSTFGSDATFTISVQPNPGAPTPTGTVRLFEGTTELGSATLNGSGNATITLDDLSVGTHTVHVTYDGDSNFGLQKSGSFDHTVEEPPFGPPLNVTATGNGAANQITIHWTPTADSASFDVLRRLNGAWQVIAPNVTGDTFVDSNVVNTNAYVYAVRSHSTLGATSGESNSDVATTATLALPADHRIRASDILTTRSLVSSLRSAAGQSQFTFTDASLSGVRVKAVHINELRAVLNAARGGLGLPALTFTNPSLTQGSTPVRLVDIQEIRNSFE